MLQFHRTWFILTIVFFLRVRSRTLCAQWTCHVFSGLAYLVFPFPVSRATSSCTRMFPFRLTCFPLRVCVYEYGLSTRPRLLVCFTFSPFVSSTRTLTFLAYAIPFYVWMTRLPTRYFWTYDFL